MDHLEVKKCETCGKTKHISEFSKSYKNRCKDCVAKHIREVRSAKKLTARIKPTGETVEVEPHGNNLANMEKIIIEKLPEGGFNVIQGNKYSGHLGYDEMLGLVSSITMPENRPCLQWLKTKGQHDTFYHNLKHKG